MVKTIKAIYLSGIIALVTTTLYGYHAQELFLQGNKCYQGGNPHDAMHMYEKIEDKGPGVWFNLGNCFYAQGNYINAIVCWKRAHYGASLAMVQQLRTYIATAYQKIGISDSSKSAGFVDQLTYLIPIVWWQLLFLVCWYGLWAVSSTTRSIRYRKLSIAFLSVVSMCIAALIVVYYTEHKHKKGITIYENYLSSGPHEQYHTLGSLAPCTQLTIYEELKGWYKVAAGNQIGWIQSSSVEQL